MLHIYYGNGKGKTTAAVGLTVRAIGSGMKTAFFQFLKNGSSSEISVLKSLENNTVICCEECKKFTFAMNDIEINEVTIRHTKMLRQAADMLISEQVQLVVLDEFIDAYISNLDKRMDTGAIHKLDKFGMWIKSKDEYVLITYIEQSGINSGTEFASDWQDVFYNYTFLDGTPCGKQAE